MKQEKQTIQLVRQHSRQLVRELDVVKGVYFGSGYTLTQLHVMFEISANKSLGLMELADALLIDKSNASRTVKRLVEQGLIQATKEKVDKRQKTFSLTRKGELALNATIVLANEQVETALNNLNNEQHQQVIDGMRLYADALKKGRLQAGFTIRRIQKKDNLQVANVIRNVMTEYGAVGEGYSIVDPEVSDMFGNYREKNARYYVIEFEEQVVGCGGIAPLKGGGKFTCELRKMFFLPETRGKGLGRRLLLQLISDAKKIGYKKCYLETLVRMKKAIALYERNGFVQIDSARGNTGHSSCDRYLEMEL